MVPTCNKQMNILHFALISNFVLGYCIAAAPDPARDYIIMCVNHSIETQATSPTLNLPRVFILLQCMECCLSIFKYVGKYTAHYNIAH